MFRQAEKGDLDTIFIWDKHISRQELETIIQLKRVYIAENNRRFIGWLRYNLFWDNTPFMNMLYLLEDYRRKGIGRDFVVYWEKEMCSSGYKKVMTSTSADEYAQHFYHRLGYHTIGGFIPQGDYYELILEKIL